MEKEGYPIKDAIKILNSIALMIIRLTIKNKRLSWTIRHELEDFGTLCMTNVSFFDYLKSAIGFLVFLKFVLLHLSKLRGNLDNLSIIRA